MVEELKNVFIDLGEAQPFVYVDDWVPQPEDFIFTTSKGLIELNDIARIYGLEDHHPIAFYSMASKKCYNGATVVKPNGDVSIGFRDHCIHYLNYFEKFYDTEHTVVNILAQLKYLIEYHEGYNEDILVADIQRYFISKDSNPVLHYDIHRFVRDNYNIHLTYKNKNNPCLEYRDYHACILFEISILQNMIIPTLIHFSYLHQYTNQDIQRLLLRVFDNILFEVDNKYNVDMASKLFETILTNVNKNKKGNPVLWDMQEIRARNPISHAMETQQNILVQIIPKYSFKENIISFNFFSIQNDLNNKVLRAKYEYALASVSSSNVDEDNNSEADKFEAHLAKMNESAVIQSTLNCNQTIQRIEALYGPFSEDEINFYMKELGKEGKNIKNQFQFNLVSYLFLKEFKDIQAVKLVTFRQYIIMLLAAKKYLISAGQSLLPYIIGGRVEKIVSRKTVNKKILQKIQFSENYPKIVAKYNNKKIQEEIIFKTISQILASDFRNIDFYNQELNGIKIQCIPEKISEELLQYILLI